MTATVCRFEECEARSSCQGYCDRCYQRGRKAGWIQKLPRRSFEERFWAKVDKTGTCWLWTGAIADTGYGTCGNPSRLAHRVSYELVVGQIPDGEELDHLCRVRHCVNPDHLEPVTRGINVRRGYWQSNGLPRAEYCRRGHRYAEVGYYTRPDNGKQSCHRCVLDRAKTGRALRRERTAFAAGPKAYRTFLKKRDAQRRRYGSSLLPKEPQE